MMLVGSASHHCRWVVTSAALLGLLIASCEGAKKRGRVNPGDGNDTIDELDSDPFTEDGDAGLDLEHADADAESTLDADAADHDSDKESEKDGSLDGPAESSEDGERFICEYRAYKRCDGNSYYWYDSCDVRDELIETCIEPTRCRNTSETEARCCIGSTHTQCHQGSVFWFDECGFLEDVAELCPTRNAECVNTSDSNAECRCRNHWTGDSCEICPGHWNPIQDCDACIGDWTGEDCTEHPDIFLDPGTGLMWQILPRDDEMMWQIAREHCQMLELSGYSSWRMPTIDELRSIVQSCHRTVPGGTCGVTDECYELSCFVSDSCRGCPDYSGPDEDGCYWWPELDGSEDVLRACSVYWSSTELGDGENVWFVSFVNGSIHYSRKGSIMFVRCVRDP